MDQHTFLELVVLGAAIALSGYIGYAIGWEKGSANTAQDLAHQATEFSRALTKAYSRMGDDK